MKQHQLKWFLPAAVLGLLALALPALPANAAPVRSAVTASTATSSVALTKPTVIKTTAVRNASGIYVAKTAGGSTVATLNPFTYTETRTVAPNGDVTGSAAVAYTGNMSKAQLLAQATAMAGSETDVLAKLAMASGQSAAGAASVFGSDVGLRVTQLKAQAAAASAATVQPASAAPAVAASSSGCNGHTLFAPVSGYTNNTEITINIGGYSCMDYASGGNWYVVESLTQSYETKDYTWYKYYPQRETMNHYHTPSGGNSYLDWSPYTATPSISGCGTKSIGLTDTVSGLSYGTSEDYCDGKISPWTSNAATRIYSGSRFDCTTGWTRICYTDPDTWYGQKAVSLLHSPPAASYYSSFGIGYGWFNQKDIL